MRSKIAVEVTATLFHRVRSKYQARAVQRGLRSALTDGQLADFAFERLLDWLQDTESEAARRAAVQKWREENRPVEMDATTDIPVIQQRPVFTSSQEFHKRSELRQRLQAVMPVVLRDSGELSSRRRA